jgi:hypothetical protein
MLCALLLPASFLAADCLQVMTSADLMHDQGRYADARAVLLEAVTTASGREASELYWRISRETEELGNQAEKSRMPKARIIAYFDQGETYADAAIRADPGFDFGYFWKCIAILGRLGQVRGVFNALSQAGPIRDLLLKTISLNPDRALAWFVLGQLYRELPGWPFSFGSTDIAVSLGRKAVDLNMAKDNAGAEKGATYNFQLELAKSLYNRNWSADQRLWAQKEKAARLGEATKIFEKAALFEATVTLKDESDRQEAESLVREVVGTMESLPELTASQRRDLANARETLARWQSEQAFDRPVRNTR